MIIIVLFFILVIYFFLYASYKHEQKDMSILLAVVAGMLIMSVILTCGEMIDKHTDFKKEINILK